MPTHISIATALDKNKLASATVYLMLMEVDVRNSTGAVVTTIYATNNTEAYVFGGVTYQNIPFEVTLTQEKDTLPTAQLTVYDLAQVFQAQLQAYGTVLDWPVRIKVINTSGSAATVDMQQNFSLTSAVAKDDTYNITFTLSGENPLTLRWPPRDQFRNRCFWVYKSTQCGYTGSMAACDFTIDGTIGCRAHANTLNFGGFPGITRSLT